MEYNCIVFSDTDLASQYIHGMGSDFTTIRNTFPLPPEWRIKDIDELAEVTVAYLTLILTNRKRNADQRANLRSTPTPPPAPISSTPRTPPVNPYLNRRRKQPPPPPAVADSLVGASPSSSPVTGEPRLRCNGAVDFRSANQINIMPEIGYHAHTPIHTTLWLHRAGPNFCYYHRPENHVTSDCIVLRNYITRAGSGTPSDRPFVPNVSLTAVISPRQRSTLTPAAPVPIPSPSEAPP